MGSRRTQPASLGWRIGVRLQSLLRATVYLGILSFMATLRMIPLLFTASGRHALHAHWEQQNNAFMQSIVQWLRELPRAAQRLLIVALLLGFLFVQSLVFLAERQVKESEIINTTKVAIDIQNALDRAESDIIFGNDTEATALIKEAASLMPTLPQRTTEQRNRWQLLANAIGDTRKSLERIVMVETPTIVASVSSELFTDPDGFVLTNGKLLLYRGQNNTFAVTDLTTKSTQPLAVTVANLGHLSQTVADDNGRLVFLHDGKGLVVLTLSTQTLTNETIDSEPTAPAGGAIYNGRLYLLDPGQSQVWRYQKTSAGYGGRVPWLRENVASVAEATSLVGDGNVYILTADGTVQRLVNGAVDQTWRSQPLLDTPKTFTKLLNPGLGKTLYAMNPEGQRITVWQKDSGRLQAQYLLPSLKHLKDFAVDETNQVLYLLDDNQILQVLLNKQPGPVRQ